MKNNKALLVALVLSLGLTVFLSVKGCQSNTAEVQDTVPPPQLEHDHDHDHDHNETSEHTDSEVMSLIENNLDREDLTDAELAELFEACDYAHSKSLISQEQMLKNGKLRIAKSSIPKEI
ncbi:MAG: hypothetical protein JJ975_15850, partial [Bacteroidia bacterium]|nr:hypothetical protein [Bacteroidia bacterium]